MQDSFFAGLTELAELLGLPPGDLADEHSRWKLYCAAAHDPEDFVLKLLEETLAKEPDEHLVVGAVFSLVESRDYVPPGGILDRLDMRSRGAIENRISDMLEYRGLAEFGPQRPVDQWSDWLQRRVAEASDIIPVLTSLAESGRTRKVRALAGARVRSAQRRSTR